MCGGWYLIELLLHCWQLASRLLQDVCVTKTGEFLSRTEAKEF